jgi:predicted dehydrogenase
MQIGLLGLGFMGSTHWNGLARIPGVKVAAVMDADEKRLSGDLSGIQGNLGEPGKALDFTGIRKYRTVAEILADPGLDAVDICLPTRWHAEVTIQALRAGKHVLVEKPMALEGESADAMIEEARKADRILMVAQVLRFMPPYQGLSSLVKSGRLGTIRSAFFRRRTAVPTWAPWEFDSTVSGGGVFDLLIHDVDMALHLFGVPRAVSASGHEALAGGTDFLMAQFHYPDVASVSITGGWHHRGEYPFSMEYTVVGENGVVEFSSAGRPATVYWADGRKEVLPDAPVDPYHAEIEYFIECCRQRKAPQACPPEESSLAVKLARLAADSRSKAGVPVPFAG